VTCTLCMPHAALVSCVPFKMG